LNNPQLGTTLLNEPMRIEESTKRKEEKEKGATLCVIVKKWRGGKEGIIKLYNNNRVSCQRWNEERSPGEEMPDRERRKNEDFCTKYADCELAVTTFRD